jgi:hypothetical protein
MKPPLFVLAVVVALSSAHASAKVVSFPADNFSIDTPEGWLPVPAPSTWPGSRVITAARNPTSGSAYLVLKAELPSTPVPADFLAGALKRLTSNGLKASPLRDETINGRPFTVVSVSPDTGRPFMLMASTFTSKSAFVVETIAVNGNVEKTPELNAILHSFRFLQPVRSISRHDTDLWNFSNPFIISYQLGRLAGILIIAIVVILLIKKVTQSSR